MASPLHKLLKRRPTSREITSLVAEIKTDGPRGAAIVAGALIDDVASRPVAEPHDSSVGR